MPEAQDRSQKHTTHLNKSDCSNTVNNSSIYRRIRALNSFQYISFRLVWLAHWCHVAAMWSVSVILGWVTFDITGSPFFTAISIGVGAIPPIILGPIAGIFIDAWNRKQILAVTCIFQCFTTLIFSYFVWVEMINIWNILTFSIINGIWDSIYFPTMNATVSNTVPRKTLVNAFSLIHLADSFTRLFVPIVTGLLISLVGPGPSTLLPALFLFISFLASSKISLRSKKSHPINIRSAYLDMVVASKYIGSNRAVLGFILVVFAPLFFVTPVNIGLMPVYASEVFGGGPKTLGILVSALGTGMTIGTVILASLRDIRRLGISTIASMLGMAMGLLVFSRTSNLIYGIIVLIPYGVSMTAFWTLSGSALQIIVPDKLRGRVTSMSMLTHTSLPMGTVLVGILSEQTGIQTASAVSSIGMILFTLITFVSIPKMSRFTTNT